MQNYKKNLVAGTMVASLVLGGAGTALAATGTQAKEANDNAGSDAVQTNSKESPALIKVNAAEGLFSYDQSSITPNRAIADVFRRATSALCGARNDLVADNPLGWKLSVLGEVDNSFTADVGQLASESGVKQVMTCTCGGNPADGTAIITAEVKGIPITHLLDRSGAREGVNTITFVSSDGTELALPLGYVVGRHAVISYKINEEDLSASVGGNNQLWMTRTPANYFVRDIVEVRLTKETNPPVNPGEEAVYPNSPNVGILSSSTR